MHIPRAPRRRLLGTSALVASLFGLLALTGWWIYSVSAAIGGLDMPAVGWVALVEDVTLSLGVGVGLMFLVFYSSRKGHDDPPDLTR